MIRDLIPSNVWPERRWSDKPFEDMRRAFDRFFEGFSTDLPEVSVSKFVPKLSLTESDSELVLTAELPGLSDKDVTVELDRDILTVKGEKKSEKEEKDGGKYYCERSFGSFERSIRLPSGMVKEKIDASVRDGVLTVKVPKSPEAKTEFKKIPVRH